MQEFTDLLKLLAILCVPAATLAVFIPLGRALARRVESRVEGQTVDELIRGLAEARNTLADVRLAVDTLASEVERQGEAFRHASKLLAQGRTGSPVPESKSFGTITPH
jgi:hypothetical protein